jgi:hypothetical protein
MQPNREFLAPNISKCTTWFNEVSFWVQTEILTCLGNQDRAEVFKKFVEICEVKFSA